MLAQVVFCVVLTFSVICFTCRQGAKITENHNSNSTESILKVSSKTCECNITIIGINV